MEKHSMDKDSIDSLLDEKDSYSKESYKPIKFKKARKSWRLSSLASRILCPLHLPALKLPQLQKKKDVPLILPAVSDKPDSEGRLPIHHAALLGDAKIIRDLNSSLNIEDATNLGWRPIHLAAMGDHVDVAVVLKDLGAKLDAKSKHPVGSANTGFITHFPITALQLSLIKGNQGIAKFLLEDGADYEVMGPMGQGLLHYAAHSGSKEVFLDLVGKGLDPFQKDGNHLLPFHWAACENRVEICKEYIRLCKNRGMSLDIEQNHGETPMGCALRRGHAETAKLLLEAGADPHHRNAVGHTTLMFAPFAKDNGLLNSIVSAGADVNVGDYVDKITALHVACAKKNAEAVKVLVEQGADINAMTSDGWTPLMVAIDYHSVEVTSYLLSQGANVGLEDKFGFSAFEYCGGYAPIVELLEPYRKEFYELQRIVRIPEKVRAHLRTILDRLPDKILQGATTLQKVERSMNLWTLANGLFVLRDFEGTRTCLEMAIFNEQWFEREQEYDCRICERESGYNQFWVCKECPILRGVCAECHGKVDVEGNKVVMLGCKAEHEYFEVGGKEWSQLGPGQVDKNGKTIDDVVKELKKRFCGP